MNLLKVITLSFCISLFSASKAQDLPNDNQKEFATPNDTLSSVVQIKKRQSPLKAALLSAALPGAGQIYNRKYWKLPIVYGGLAGLGTWIGLNAKNLKGYTNAYKLELDGDPNTIGEYKGFTGETQLRTKREDTKRSLDLSIILTAVFYALHIVDASVDAHLFDYSITEDLSVKLNPDFRTYEVINTNQPSLGFSVQLHFHKAKNY